jgi:hypothetical protein
LFENIPLVMHTASPSAGLIIAAVEVAQLMQLYIGNSFKIPFAFTPNVANREQLADNSIWFS